MVMIAIVMIAMDTKLGGTYCAISDVKYFPYFGTYSPLH